jgi:Zn-dependent metalloprotease
MKRTIAAFAMVAACAAALTPVVAQRTRLRTTVAASSARELREWGERLRSMERSRDLRVRLRRADPLVAGRIHDRLDQYHGGVRVFGADVAQQYARGLLVSAFGSIYQDIDVDTTPTIDATRAREVVRARAGSEPGPNRQPELVILPRDSGRFALTWRLRATSGSDFREYFVDAHSGAIIHDYSVRRTQSTVGRATGVLGDSKKISVSPNGGRFYADDRLRPPSIVTYDLAGDFLRALRIINGSVTPGLNDIASDSDNVWTDGAAADAHIYSGWTYDFYFKRFGRRGIDNNDLALRSIVHPASRQDFDANFDIVPDFYVNAAYYGEGLMVYGVGLPPGLFAGGQTVDFWSGALDIVAHEISHGVGEYSSGLIYQDESGALDEAFSDIMGTSVEYFFQPAGDGLLRADYLIGEDAIRPGGLRSMSDPGSFGDPDHYSRRFLGDDDNGGVHINSGIVNHAFYLAIEGGTNRTSGLAVQSVGAANREQIERVFYRAFTEMLNATATFATARAATIQTARDLYGAGSPAERAVTQAWTAVGVE